MTPDHAQNLPAAAELLIEIFYLSNNVSLIQHGAVFTFLREAQLDESSPFRVARPRHGNVTLLSCCARFEGELNRDLEASYEANMQF